MSVDQVTPDSGCVWPISLAPPTDPVLRRAGRLLAMVHELHKAGYQRLRIASGRSVDGKEWRCRIIAADNVRANGWEPIDGNRGVAYSSSDGKAFFGWDDSENDGARRLAAKFIQEFPVLMREATGADWPYAGWFVSTLGAAENGTLPVFFAGLDFVPLARELPPPPPADVHAIAEPAGDGALPLVANERLTGDMLPQPGADYERLWPFCLTYDGYRGGLFTPRDCELIADRAAREGLQRASIDQLRTAAFFHQRKIKWNDQWPPDPESVRSIQSVVEELRRRLGKGPR